MNRACKDGHPGTEGGAVQVRYPRWKRVLDVVLIGLFLPALLPLVVLLSLWILMVSGRPVLFKQERVGYLGREFTCYKFRTMHDGVDTQAHQAHVKHLIQSDLPMTKMDMQGDSRLIPLALPLRAVGLDELPQLINVLRGEMSLVGPRPCLPCEYQNYLPWQRERFNTLPGLTGLWQVSGKNKTTFAEMIRLDIEYARNRSFGKDVKILGLTIPALIIQWYETRRSKKAPLQPAAVERRRNERERPGRGVGGSIQSD